MTRRVALAAALLLIPAYSSAQGAAERFDIERFQIEGNTLLGNEELAASVQPFTGKGRVYGDVKLALEALRQRYLAMGYSVVWVVAPEQDLDRGFVTLQVIEGWVGKVTIEGNRHFGDDNIRASLPALREGTPGPATSRPTRSLPTRVRPSRSMSSCAPESKRARWMSGSRSSTWRRLKPS